jgi:glucosylceramidase
MQRAYHRLLLGAGSVVIVFLVGLLISGGIFSPAKTKAAGTAVNVWLTTTDGNNKLTQQASLAFSSDSQVSASTIVDVNENQQYQQMDGFGAAITDSSAWLIYNKMSASQRTALMTNLFSISSGIGLGFVRIPMGASDFSVTGAYSYDDMPAGQTDPTLAKFSISHDTTYIIPIIQQALAINPSIKFMANPWSPPAWMKTNNSMFGVTNGNTGTLQSSAYAPLAQYFVKFLQAYQAQGIPIYMISPQNEPAYAPPDYPGMIWAASDENNWIKNNLEPALTSASLNPKIVGWDHDWNNTSYAQTLLNDPTTNSDLAGISWHCYNGSPTAMTQIHSSYPTKDMFETECATGSAVAHTTAINLLMESVQNWAKTVELWNLALDTNRGPHTGGCTDCYGVATIDQSTGNATYGNDFYQLGHFSKFVAQGAYHIAGDLNSNGLQATGFKNPDGSKVEVVYNSGSSSSTFKVRWNSSQSFAYTLPAGALVTFTWSNSSPTTPTPGTTPTSSPATSTPPPVTSTSTPPTSTPTLPTATPTSLPSTPTPLPATPTPPSGSNGVTATGVVASSSPYYSEENVKFSNTSAITAMAVTITVQKTSGVSYNGMYTTFGGVTTTHADNGSTIVYTYTLNAGQTIPPSSNLLASAQFGGNGTAHSTTGDTWSITTTSGGVANTVSGHF